MNSLGDRIGKIPLTLIALVFAVAFTAGGVVAGVVPIYKQLSGWWEASSYVAVQAHVVSVELETRPISKSRSERYRVVADFSYEYRGQNYLSHRVSLLDGGGDNVGTYQQDTYELLRQARSQLSPVTVWVNPARPDQAVYDRSIRWLMIVAALPFAILFFGGGLVAWWVIWRTWRRQAQVPPAAALGADNPPRPTSNSLLIRAEAGASQMLLLSAVFWNALCWPMAIIIFSGGAAVPSLIWLMLSVFLAIGLALIAKAWSVLRARWRMGPPVLALSNSGLAGKIPLQGEIMFSPALGLRADAAETMHAVKVSVECVQGTRRNVKPADSAILWRGEAVQTTVVRGTQTLKFKIDLPEPLPAVRPVLKWATQEYWQVVLETLGGKVMFMIPHAVVGSGALSLSADHPAVYSAKMADRIILVFVSFFLALVFAIPYVASKQNSRSAPKVPQGTASAEPVVEAPFELDSLAGNGFGVVAHALGRMEIRDNTVLIYPDPIELRSFQSCAPTCPSIIAVQFMLTREGRENFSILATSASIPVLQHLPDQSGLTVYVPSEKVPLVLNFADRRQLADLRLTLSIEGSMGSNSRMTEVSWYTHAHPFKVEGIK
jgi:hypothetical protein